MNLSNRGYLKYRKPTKENPNGVLFWCLSYRQNGKVKRSEIYLDSGQYIVEFERIAFYIWNQDIKKDSFIDSYVRYNLKHLFDKKEMKLIIRDYSEYPNIKLLSGHFEYCRDILDGKEKKLSEDFEELENELKMLNHKIKNTISNIVEYKTMRLSDFESREDWNDRLITLYVKLQYSFSWSSKLMQKQKKIIYEYIYNQVKKKINLDRENFLSLIGII